jgi:hypothetical protein
LAPDITPSGLATVPTNRPVLVCAKADAKLTQNTKDNNIAFFMIYLQLKTLFLNNFCQRFFSTIPPISLFGNMGLVFGSR